MTSVNITTSNVTDSLNNQGHAKDFTSEMHKDLFLYIGVSVAAGIIICICITIIVLLYKRRAFSHSSGSGSVRRLFVRGFSTVSQRGVLDSTAEFEILNMMSVSSENGGRQMSVSSTKSGSPPKKPQRKKTRTSSSNPKYENVAIEPNAGFVIQTGSTSSDIPYMDTTLESRLSRDELDDVFE